MKKIILPKEIEAAVGGLDYSLNDIGKSDSEVRMYEKYVLKIQPQNAESDNEYAIAKWLDGRLPVPSIASYCVENGKAFTLMSIVRGRMLCSKEYLSLPEQLIDLVSQGLKRLWEIDINNCPCKVSRLTERLKMAEYNVANGLVDVGDAERETFAEGSFRDPEELLGWLRENRPQEDLVLSHGDYCLPNIFTDGTGVSGFIDIGKMGPADRWQDIAIAMRSLKDNLDGRYSGGVKYCDFRPEMLSDALGIPFDEEKYRYYILLGELF